MAMTESDDVENITEGKYVYWMNQDDDIARGQLGEVCEVVDDDTVKVRFAGVKMKISPQKLNVSDLQKGTFVHSTLNDHDFDTIGQVLDLEDGKLVVEIKGEKVNIKPKYLMRCDFQCGMYVYWTNSDDDIPKGHMGIVIQDLNDEGRVKVNFPKGCWRFKPSQMVRAHIQPMSYVQWTSHDDDIAKGEIGQVLTEELDDEGRVKVQFSKGAWRFKPSALFLHEMQLGAFVTWSKHDNDIEKGDVGQVVGIKVEEGRLRVQFPKGRWTFKANTLKLHHVQPGMFVNWTCSDGDIPRGDIGEVVRLREGKNRVGVQWPRGNWSIKPKELKKLPFQRGDRVQWNSADDDIPEGDIGLVIGINYKEEAGDRLYVQWTKGRWGMKPKTLKSIGLDADAINQLKVTFKRFDKNGDGKLTLEELTSVLGRLGDGEGGLSEDDCQQLFEGLDKDSDGKLTSSEFIDYVFGGQATGSQRKLLGEGFGLEDLVGLDEESEDEDDDNPNDSNNGGGGNVVENPPPAVVSNDPAIMEGIGPETEVSPAEWASAMLAVGVCRQAALESFDGCQAALGKEGNLLLQDLAAELNGVGGGPGVEELRDAIGKVKCGTVSAVDLDTPAEESDLERELATKTGIDGLLYYLSCEKKSLDDAAGEIENAKLTALETTVLSSMDGDALVEAAKAQAQEPMALSALSSWQRARENCRKEVNAIIESCKGSGEKYTDPTWNPIEDSNSVMYVDHEKPGWDCTVRTPSGWKRAQEMRDDYKLFEDNGNFNDIHQGSTGDCYLLGGLASVAANRKTFFRQVFIAYDAEVGVFGLLFCKDSHFTYVVVDDYLATRSDGRTPQFGRSTDSSELWVPILEKAFFKHYTCIEMCDGGHGTEAMFSFVGGVTGRYDVGDDEYDHPEKFFEKLQRALKSGELMTTGFREPSKGKYANMGGGAEGQCGEKGLPFGLHGGHCYSLLRVVEANDTRLLCMRNPWAHGEWTGPWGDKSEEWTDEMKEACGLTTKDDGVFWMAVEDFVQVASRANFARTFGPSWQTVKAYNRFSDTPLRARAKKAYQAQDDAEISFQKGDTIEVIEVQGYWAKGKVERTGEEGFYRAKDAEMKTASVYKYEFSVSDIADEAPVILTLMRENQKQCREWNKRKEDGVNYKNTKYSSGYWFIFNSKGKRVAKQRCGSRHVWQYVPSGDGPYTVYITCPAGNGKRFSVQGFAPHGSMQLKEIECSYSEFLDRCG